MKKVVISVGGSLIYPKVVDTKFLQDLKPVIEKAAKKHKIVIVTGGGFIARDYIHALNNKTKKEKDTIGVACTRLNARLLSSYIKNSNKNIPTNMKEIKSMVKRYSVVITGGLSSGTTSDGTTAAIAKELGADIMINLTNVKGLYDKDPRKYKSAKFIPYICHKHFKQMIDKIHEKPGQHFVLDTTAARICKNNKMKVIIMKGTKNLDKLLTGKKFAGTTIS